MNIPSKDPHKPKSCPGLEMMLAHASCLARFVLLLTLNKTLPGGYLMFSISLIVNKKG
jgi:hypothetical protein